MHGEQQGFAVPPMMKKSDRIKASRSRTKVVVASTTLLLVGGAAMTDEGQHFFRAVRRTIRVISTLAICVNE
jgi:3-deoxy-D-arabino-heptulosonate 7-phosphate (DAHP) synthase class II